ncbi:NAD(P)H-dependent oxidoreductase [Actinobacillus lignieresii]|uniref:NAD(P)H dehydrogenase (Quinone) n=1 Tax=Actinobacillus lignieresii TaxID=720 RepID=A0A380U034_ACTLI|nr:NAD(P)H-dependent oxidoreductase [Actinobacillus lignieresii]SUT93682.1 NAD(P)H dehydrogenase (quinone) [Actinobacillus lignieresii]
MKNVLVISGHSNLSHSTANARILKRLENEIANVQVRDLAGLYGNQEMDIAAEQAALVQADVVVFQYPMYWYSVPAILKRYFDEVFTYGFAYGTNGDKLHGKKVIFSYTVGGAEDGYNGELFHRFDDLLAPLKDTAKFSGLVWQAPVHSSGMLYIPGVSSEDDLAQVQAKADEHAERLIKQIQSL